VQRGHQNSLENLPTFLGLLTIAGLKVGAAPPPLLRPAPAVLPM
jgi:hypothetical protein